MLSPKLNSLSGPVDQQSPQAKQALPIPFGWKSFLSSTKKGRLKTNLSCLGMINAEQGTLFQAIRHALQSLRKNKVLTNTQRQEVVFKLLFDSEVSSIRVLFRNNVRRLQQ